MVKYWFRAKKYGWGWYPSSWQGWAILLVFVAVFVFTLVFGLDQKNIAYSLFNISPMIAIELIVLIAICYRTGEKPRWRWPQRIGR